MGPIGPSRLTGITVSISSGLRRILSPLSPTTLPVVAGGALPAAGNSGIEIGGGATGAGPATGSGSSESTGDSCPTPVINCRPSSASNSARWALRLVVVSLRGLDWNLMVHFRRLSNFPRRPRLTYDTTVNLGKSDGPRTPDNWPEETDRSRPARAGSRTDDASCEEAPFRQLR